MNGIFFTLAGFIRKELRQTLRDPKMRFLLFLAPIFQLTVFGVALSNEVKNIRIAAFYEPGDWLAEDIMQHSLASGWFVPAKVSGNEPFEWVRSGQADAVIVSPPSGAAHAAVKGDANLQLLVNAQNVIRAQAVEAYFSSILANAAGTSGIRLSFDVRPLYNPTFNTSLYMVPGVMSMLVCLVTIMLTSMAVAREREVGTLETLISAPVSSKEILLGKTVPFVLLGLLQVPLILTAAVVLFRLPVRGPLLFLALASFFFVLNTVSIGLLVSTIARSQQQAMLGGFLFLFPAVLLSGLMFPLENMPLPLWILSQINPLTHFIGLLRNILLKGGSNEYFLIHSAILAALSVFFLWAAAKRFHSKLAP